MSISSGAYSPAHELQSLAPRVCLRNRRSSALRQLGDQPFTTQMAREAGMTRSDLRSPSIRRVRRGVYIAAHIPRSLALDCAALLMITPPGTRIAGQTALRLLELPAQTGSRMCISVPSEEEVRMQGVISLFHKESEGHLNVASRFGAIPVTRPVDLLLEVIEHVTFVEAVELVDAFFTKWPADAVRLKNEWGCVHGIARRMLRDVLTACVYGVESPMETRTRLLLICAGFPKPHVQYELSLDGRLRRFDLAYPDLKIAIEYDGAHHFMTEERKHDDATRRDAAARAGWIVISVVPYGIYRDPAGTIHRVAEAFRSRGVRVVLKDDWGRYFVQRV